MICYHIQANVERVAYRAFLFNYLIPFATYLTDTKHQTKAQAARPSSAALYISV